MWMDTWVGSKRVVPSWWFESFIWGTSSGFPLASHLALPDSESMWFISGSFHVYTHIF